MSDKIESDNILDKVDYPEDLKDLSIEELEKLASEIREIIIKVVSESGGHLSSNLGVVDLTLALHKVFDAPKDKIIWDVGHQCYTHKIITGRKDRISTIRKKNGLMGYPDIFESEYDSLNTGHASTSIAFASGMAIANEYQKDEKNIIAVIGDGALTGGVALEALDHIGQIKQKLIIILNDNEMSISPNVGGLSKHLSYLVAGRPYIRLKEMVQGILKYIPGIGKSMAEIAKKIELLARTVMVPGSLFDELGIKYIGPINGHNYKDMIKEFEDAKKYDYPVLLHIVTKKGYGYKPATDDPSSFHSSAPFEITNGKFKQSSSIPSYSKVFGKTVLRMIKDDEKIIAITAAMPSGTGLDIVQKEKPDNFFDVGIAEQYMFDFAGGLSLEGLKPVISIYSTFLQRAIDQVSHDISLMKIPIVVGLDRAGLVGGDGPTHQGIYDIAFLRPIPNIVIMAPKDENELQHMIYTAVNSKRSVFIRYPKEPAQGVEMDAELKEIPIGRAEVVKEGRDGVLLVVGTLVSRALQAAERLSKEDKIDVTVINIRTIKPIDKDLIVKYVTKNKKIITIEDGIRSGGLSTIIRELIISEQIKKAKILSLGVSEEIIEVATREELLEKYNLNASGIYDISKDFLKKNKISFLKI